MSAPRDAALVDRYGAERVVRWLSPLVSAERLALLERIVSARRKDLTVLADKFYDPHNTAAVMRSAEAFGLREVHAVPGNQGLQVNAMVSQGVEKWIDLVRHESTDAATDALARQGYMLVGADINGVRPDALPSDRRLCFIMGAEKPGLGDGLRQRCDVLVSIPMVGMVESFNVSVAAAILMYAASTSRPPELLSDDERRELLARYLVQTVAKPEVVMAELALREPEPVTR